MTKYYRSKPNRKAAPRPRKGASRRRRRRQGQRFDFASLALLDGRRLLTRPGSQTRRRRKPSLLVRGRRWLGQRAWNLSHAAAALLFMLATAALAYGFISLDFFVYDAEVANARYTPTATVYERAGIDGFSIFFIDPETVAARVKTLPHVGDARVRVGLPDRVRIELVEREPAILYQVQGDSHWIDAAGSIASALEPREGLIKLIDDEASARIDQDHLDPSLLQAILHIHDTLPQVTTFRYQSPLGLFFFSPEGWRVYLGSAEEMDAKLRKWEATRRQILAEGASPEEVDLRFKQPYWR